MRNSLLVEVSTKETSSIIKKIPTNKSPALDGYTAEFYTAAWEKVGEQVIAAVKEFFISGRMLKQFNATLITLIPKCPHPSKVRDYRPIACCNLIFKCISKVIAERLKKCLPHLNSWNQSAFVEGRQILDNILLAQEIVRL